jgi:hypothetical protein
MEVTMSKQSAVEWLESQINLGLSERGLISAFKEAKQMEKEQKKEEYLKGIKSLVLHIKKYEPTYPNETYGGNNENT